jgi:hypothetical protein
MLIMFKFSWIFSGRGSDIVCGSRNGIACGGLLQLCKDSIQKWPVKVSKQVT